MVLYPLKLDDNFLLDSELSSIGCDPKALPIFGEKSKIMPVKIKGVKAPMANIIKQEMLSAKGDAAVNALTVNCGVEASDIILFGTVSVYRDFIRKISWQDYPTLNEIRQRMDDLLAAVADPVMEQKIGNGRALRYDRPLVMGILNMTVDSFFEGSRFPDMEKAMTRCREMIAEGADIIDIGGESTRPGAEPVPMNEEMDRVIPLVESLRRECDIPISVDTYKSAVAEEALKAGADIINDISGLSFDELMADVVRRHDAVAVIMHMKGTPRDMQTDPYYDDVLSEIVDYFDNRLAYASLKGISPDKLIVDPGIGFGKRFNDNLNILAGLGAFRKYGMPVMVGASRKAMIGTMLGGDKPLPPGERLSGTLGAHAMAVQNGASIIRVHDVREHAMMVKVMQGIKGVNAGL